MRQIGSFPEQSAARRFTAYLITQGIDAQAEENGLQWTVWVREEDQLSAAREALAEFKTDPENARYRHAEQAAEEIQREARSRQEAAKQHTVHMRDRWGTGPRSHRRPLTIAVIAVCGFLFVASDGGESNSVTHALMFCNPQRALVIRRQPAPPEHNQAPTPGSRRPRREVWQGETVAEKLIDIRRGQVWRLLTPVFLHGGAMHLLFNMVMFYQLGSALESRLGSRWLAMMIVFLGVTSNLAQALAPNSWGGGVFFYGFSGVVYGLLGYAWMAGRYQPSLGIHVPQATIVLAVTFMVLGFTGILRMPLANWAHGAGFAAGYLLGLPHPWARRI